MNNDKFKGAVNEAKLFFLKNFLTTCTNFYDECANRIMHIKEGKVEFSKVPYKKEDLGEGLKKVVIVLESPHIDEYIENGKILILCI